MQHQDPSAEDAVAVLATEASSPTSTSVPRRRLLRALSGVAIGALALAGLTSCGGEGEEDDEEEDD